MPLKKKAPADRSNNKHEEPDFVDKKDSPDPQPGPVKKKKRRRRKKKPVVDSLPTEEQTLAVSSTESKPKKKRRRKSKAGREVKAANKKDADLGSSANVKNVNKVAGGKIVGEEIPEGDILEEAIPEEKATEEEAPEEEVTDEEAPEEEVTEEEAPEEEVTEEEVPEEEVSEEEATEEETPEEEIPVEEFFNDEKLSDEQDISEEEEEEPAEEPIEKNEEQPVADIDSEKPDVTEISQNAVPEQDVPEWLQAVPTQPWENSAADPMQNTNVPSNVNILPGTDSQPSKQTHQEQYSYSVEPSVSPDQHEQYVYEHNLQDSGQAHPENKPAVFDRPYHGLDANSDNSGRGDIHENQATEFNESKFLKEVETSDSLDHKETFFEKIGDVMAQAGISLKGLIIGIVIFAVAIVLVVYSIKFIGNWLSAMPESPKIPVVAISPMVSPQASGAPVSFLGVTGISAGEKFGYYVAGKSSILPGTVDGSVPVPVTGIEVGANLGEEFLKYTGADFQQKILTLREMQNAFETDIYQMMDASQDRYLVLINHINLMKLLEQKAILNIRELGVQAGELKSKYDESTALKAARENEFFARLKELNPMASESALIQFIEASRLENEFKANYNARQKILSYHQLLLENLQKRRHDYELNIDPLVKGAKVVDVTGSDINLILKEG